MIEQLAIRKIPEFYSCIVADISTAFSTIKKLQKHAEDWKTVEFTTKEINWINNLPIKISPPNKIYRGLEIKITDLHNFPRGKIINYKPKGQYSSWTGSKKETAYFQRGGGYPVLLSALLPKSFFYLQNYFKLVDDLDSYFGHKEEILTREEQKVEDLLGDIRLYNEKEILVFGSIKATVESNYSTRLYD